MTRMARMARMAPRQGPSIANLGRPKLNSGSCSTCNRGMPETPRWLTAVLTDPRANHEQEKGQESETSGSKGRRKKPSCSVPCWAKSSSLPTPSRPTCGPAKVIGSGWQTFVQVGLALGPNPREPPLQNGIQYFRSVLPGQVQSGRHYVNRLISAAQVLYVFGHNLWQRSQRPDIWVLAPSESTIRRV